MAQNFQLSTSTPNGLAPTTVPYSDGIVHDRGDYGAFGKSLSAAVSLLAPMRSLIRYATYGEAQWSLPSVQATSCKSRSLSKFNNFSRIYAIRLHGCLVVDVTPRVIVR